jgi:hypothetical protein
MEDTVSRSSLDSSSTGDEYVVVNGEPKLKITGDIRLINDEILKKMASSSSMTSTDSLCKEPEAEVNGSGHVLQSSQSAGDLSSKQQQLNAGTLCKIKYRNVMSIFDNKTIYLKLDVCSCYCIFFSLVIHPVFGHIFN